LWNQFKEEFALGDYNQANGDIAFAGRIYVNENDVKDFFDKTPKQDACYFTIEIPKESITGLYNDPRNEHIQYMNVKAGTIPEVVGLSTKFGQYQITPQFE